MDKEIQASQIYSRVLYSRRRGCALWVPEPNNDLPPAYLETGVQIGDVGILRADGRFSFIFNACCPASDPVNRYGVPDDFQPLIWDNSNIRDNTELDGFQQVAGKWDGPRDIIPNYFRPGEPVMSRGAEKQALGAEASVSVPGVPVGVGTGFSITFAKHQGAVILPPNGVISVDCEGQRLFREYAEKNYDSWYRFLHERRGMEVEDGSIYFLTGFDKTDCWEIAVFSNNLKERMFFGLFASRDFFEPMLPFQ
ncbi:hypothetical protein L218DRAFT_194165 [Marasmius fiardii PR-910]|nr:hypothetical protein L218DRAFT_194165 [Marasmius fiardii PR-910]